MSAGLLVGCTGGVAQPASCGPGECAASTHDGGMVPAPPGPSDDDLGPSIEDGGAPADDGGATSPDLAFQFPSDSLRAIGGPLVGAAAAAGTLSKDSEYAGTLGQEFNYLTPENEM